MVPGLRSLRRKFINPSWSSIDSMDSAPASPTKSRPGSRNWDTGFPAHFCGNRNTSLPHPDADLSPNATISAEDIPVGRVHSRQKRSFFEKHKRTISHGRLAPDSMYSSIGSFLESEFFSSSADVSKQNLHNGNHHEHEHGQNHNGRHSKDGADSIAPTEGSSGVAEDESPLRPKQIAQESPKMQDLHRFGSHRSHQSSEKKRGILSRWMHR